MVPGGGTESDLRERQKEKRGSLGGGAGGREGWPAGSGGSRREGKPAPERQVQQGCNKLEARRP